MALRRPAALAAQPPRTDHRDLQDAVWL